MESSKDKLEYVVQKQKEFVLNYLHQNNLVQTTDNLVSAPKAFFINSVLQWSITQIREKKMSQTQWNKTRTMIARYLAGLVELKWVKGKIKSYEVPNDKTKGRR